MALCAHGFNGVIAKPIRMKAMPDLLERLIYGEEVWYIAA